jgi:hypothetical protein
MTKTSEVYEKIYHYTTWDGLIGIIESQSLWATNYKFLNDYSEVTLFKNKLVELLYPYTLEAYKTALKIHSGMKEKIESVGGLAHIVHKDTEVFVNAQYKATGDDIYILSFCGHHKDDNVNNNGLLSQWRGYGIDGGFILVFDTIKMEKLLEEEFGKFQYNIGHISDVIYSDNEEYLEEELSASLITIAEDLKTLFNPETLRNPEVIPNLNGYPSFVSCITRYKHCGFKEEHEVRVVALPTLFDQSFLDLVREEQVELKPEKQIKYRRNKGYNTPYIALFEEGKTTLPIERIIVGPHKDMQQRAASLRVMLRKQDIEISCSDIPYTG